MARNGRDFLKVVAAILETPELPAAVRSRLEALREDVEMMDPGSLEIRTRWKVAAFVLSTYLGEKDEVEWKRKVKEIFIGHITAEEPPNGDLP